MTYNETRLNQIKVQMQEFEAYLPTLDQTTAHFNQVSKMYADLAREKSILTSKVACEKLGK